MNTTNSEIKDGTYFFFPEGSGWIAARIRNGRVIARTEESLAATHSAARDSWAGVVPTEDDADVSPGEGADDLIRLVCGEEIDPCYVVVTRPGNEA